LTSGATQSNLIHCERWAGKISLLDKLGIAFQCWEMCTAGLAVLDPKSLELAGGGAGFTFHIADVIGHEAFDVMDDAVHFAVIPLHDQLNAAIREVSHVSADVMTESDILRGVPEANALNVSAEVVGASFHPPISPKQLCRFAL
jgi:hypothetical protein